MKPLNLDHSPCNPISSNCVIWQGPDIPCIKLCKGDTITDVVFKLATELCTIMDTLKVTSYDLACFNLAECAPNTFQELIQFLITRICALENIDPATVVTTTTSTTGTRSPAVSNYLLTAAPCFGGGTVTLIEYVDLIANRVCSIVDDIAQLNIDISSLDIRVSALEAAVPPVYTTPTFTLTCAIGTTPPLAAGTTQAINTVLEKFINEEWCPMKIALGTPADISAAIATQCVAGTDLALAVQYTSPGTIMQVAYPTYVAAPVSLADFINNTWLALCDLRDRVENWEKESVVAAGNNITVSSSTAANITTYTVNGLSTVVAGADDIVVTPSGPVAGVTTYTISRPKINFYQEVIALVNVDTDPVPNTNVYHFPVGYSTLSYTNTSGSAKTFNVHASFEGGLPSSIPNSDTVENYLDGAIIRTVVGVDTIEYESYGARVKFIANLFDGPSTTDVVDISTAEQVLTSPGAIPVEFRFKELTTDKNVSIFKRLTLNNNESVSLKFKTTFAGSQAYVQKAQLLIQET